MEILSCIFILSGILSSTIAQTQDHIKKVGIAASPLTIPSNPETLLALAQQYHPDFIELKTSCDIYRPPRPLPHIAYRSCNSQLNPLFIETVTCTHDIPKILTKISLVNSVGLASTDPDRIQTIVQETLALFRSNHVSSTIIFSIHGATLEGFINMAHRAVAAQIPYVSINLSCPNIHAATTLPYKDPDYVFATVSAVKKVLGTIPLTVKIGAFSDSEDSIMAHVIHAIAEGNADAVYGINSIPVRPINKQHKSFFGSDREVAGATGFHIRDAARIFVQKTRALIQKNNYKLQLFACGGVETSEDFETLFNAGADVVLCATAVMCNPQFTFPHKNLNRAKL